MKRKWMFLFSTPLLFISCMGKIQTVSILTDRAEMANVVEIYGSVNPDIILTINVVPSISAQIIKDKKPDLIVGTNLENKRIIPLLSPLTSFSLDYPILKAPSNSRGQPLLRPLSFELPLIIGKKEAITSLPDPVTVRTQELRTAAATYTQTNKEGRPIRIGFSPSWDYRTFIDILESKNPEIFSDGFTDNRMTNDVISEIRNWIEEDIGSIEKDKEFTKRYRYIPNEVLILQNRILFARTDFSSWASWSSALSNQLGVRYFSGHRTIPIVSVVWAGIRTKRTTIAKEAERFIDWLSRYESQEMILQRWEKDGVRVFGFLGGLSTLSDLNNQVIVKHFPQFTRMIPENHFLSIPSMAPPRWARIEKQVVQPWFYLAIERKTSDLFEYYRQWDLSSLTEEE